MSSQQETVDPMPLLSEIIKFSFNLASPLSLRNLVLQTDRSDTQLILVITKNYSTTPRVPIHRYLGVVM